jgi:hypothetical protein
MRATGVSRALHLALLVAVMAALSAGTAIGSEPKLVSKIAPPAGTRQKASSFAPHPTKRRVFGAPIQAPIVHKAPVPKKPTG